MDKKTFSARLKKMLEIRSTKQNTLAYETNIPKSVINRYCSGVYLPKHDNLIKICKVLKCNPAYLRGETDDYDDFDGLKLTEYLQATIRDVDELSIEERHCVYIYSECKDLNLKQLEQIEDYIKFIKSK